jgi:hypothetical protein
MLNAELRQIINHRSSIVNPPSAFTLPPHPAGT